MKFSRKGFVFIALIIGSLIIGGYIGATTDNSLLAYSMNLGVGNDTPLVLNLAIIKLTFGLSINISVAQVISLLTAIVFFVIISRYME